MYAPQYADHSPRSTITTPKDDDDAAMQCDDDPAPIPEMPSFLPALIIEALGYPAGLGTCQGPPGTRLSERKPPPL